MRCSKEVVVSKIITWIAKTWQMRESVLGRGHETLRKVLGQLWDNLGTILKQLGTILIQLWDSFENTYLACKDLADEGKYPWTRSRNFEKSFWTTLGQFWYNFETALRILTWPAKTWQMRESILGRGQETQSQTRRRGRQRTEKEKKWRTKQKTLHHPHHSSPL